MGMPLRGLEAAETNRRKAGQVRTVKLSYSILNAWSGGYYEDAIAYYLGKDIPPTPEMELGRLKHEQ